MANTFLTTSVIAREALMVLRNNAVMANLVHRDFSNEFVGGVGDTITVRTPASFTANEFSTAITVQDATEVGVEVKMDKLLDVSFAVTAKELSLNIVDFSNELLVPAMQAFANKIDGYLIAAAKTAAGTTRKVTQASAVTKADVIGARKFLTSAGAPLTDRRFVYNTDTEADLLGIDAFTSAEKVGDEGTALREASLGRKMGLDFYVDQNMDSVTKLKAICFHKNALALVTRPLAKPVGTDQCEIVNYDGFGLRVVRGYDLNSKKDTISIDMLCGVKALNNALVSQIATE